MIWCVSTGVLWRIRAILAAGVLTCLASGPAQDAAGDELAHPRRIEFRLADGVRIRGNLTQWDREGFDGSFGRRFWHEINPDDAWLILRSVIDHKSADHWVDVGAVFLSLTEEGERAEYAFRRALEIDPDVSEAIEDAREEAGERAERIAREMAQKHARRLAEKTPEARPWPADPWPDLTRQERITARISMMNDADRILENAGLRAETIESPSFLIYTDASREKGARWAVMLERRYRELAELMGLDKGETIFWGKPVVFIFSERDRFRLIEAGAFDQLVQSDQIAVTHFSGPKVYISAWKHADDMLFESALAHEVVHAFMHRFITPRRLPAWANEGLAEYFAQKVLDESVIHQGLRPLALQLVRGGYQVGDVLSMTYGEGTFPGDRNEGYAVGHLLIEFLIRQSRDDAFVKWVRAIKTGMDWREALGTYYDTTPEELIASFVRFYRAND